MSLKHKAARGLKWQTLTVVGRQMLSLAVFAVLARLLEPESFGLVGLIGVYLAFIGIFADQGMSTALIQREDLSPEHIDSGFWFNLGSSVALCIATILLATPVARFFDEPRLVPLLRWSSLALVINASAAVHSTLFVRDMDFRRPAVRALLAAAIGGIVGISMAVAGFGVWSLVGQQLAAAAAGAAFLWAVSKYRPSVRFSVRHFKDLFSISFSVFITAILWFLSTRLDQVVVGRFAGAAALGIYVIASKGPDLAQLLTHQPIADVALPALSRLQNDRPRMCEAIYSGMRLNALVSFAVFIGIASVASDLIPTLFGAKWSSASIYCSLLCVYALVNVLQVFFHPALLASGGIGRYLVLNGFHTAGVLAACLIGIRFSVIWLIAGLVLNALVMSVPNLLFLRSRIGLDVGKFLRPCAIPALAAAAMAATVWGVGHALPAGVLPAVRLIAKILAGAAVYSGCSLVLAPASIRSLFRTVGHAFPTAKLEPNASA
jgi:PST family polysaccharide transporter